MRKFVLTLSVMALLALTVLPMTAAAASAPVLSFSIPDAPSSIIRSGQDYDLVIESSRPADEPIEGKLYVKAIDGSGALNIPGARASYDAGNGTWYSVSFTIPAGETEATVAIAIPEDAPAEVFAFVGTSADYTLAPGNYRLWGVV